MSDWAVGDLAVCVDASICPYAGNDGGLVEDRVYTVREVVEDDRHEIGLRLVELPDPPECTYHAFYHTRFRKIRPDEQEACEPEFITLLKRSKRRVTA